MQYTPLKRPGILPARAQLSSRSGQNLREHEARFRELYDEAPVGYCEMNAEGHIIRVNRTELDMLGYSDKEMIGYHI